MIFRDVVALNISPGSRINAITFVVAVNPISSPRECGREEQRRQHTLPQPQNFPVVASKHYRTIRHTMSELYSWYCVKKMSEYLIYNHSWYPSNYHLPYPEALAHIHIPRLKSEIGRLRDKCVAYWRNRRKLIGDRRAYNNFLDHQWDCRNRAAWGGEGRREVFRGEL
jgi:hypothetical protein